MHRPSLLLLAATGLLISLTGPAVAANTTEEDVQTLRSAGLGTEAEALVAFFRKRIGSEEVRARIDRLIKQLGNDDFTAREEASAELVTLGRPAVSALRAILKPEGAKSADPEVSRRAEECLRLIETQAGPLLTAAAVRLLGTRKPPEAVALLLAYLPEAEDDNVAQEIRSTLVTLATREGKPAPALVAALKDSSPVKRGAAAEALCLAGVTGQQEAVRQLLRDDEFSVRLRAALGLLSLKDREAIPVLIALLPELPGEHAWHVEDILFRLAGEKAPAVALQGDAEARRKCRDAWAVWWRDEGGRVDLARYDPAAALLGFTVMIVFESGGKGRVSEVTRDGKVRWEIGDLSNPCDVRVIPGNHVLIAEHGANRVTERTFQNKIVWEKQVNGGPFQCQRLRNGNTFIATMSQLLEVTREGKEVYTIARSGVRAAYKFADGTIGVVGGNNEYNRLDTSGKVLKQVKVEVQISNSICGVDFLRNDRLVVTQGNKVVEYDADGKIVWHAEVPGAYPVTHAPNGNTLVASTVGQRFVEFNRQGKEVWSYKVKGTPWVARRR